MPTDGIIVCADEFRSVVFRNDDNGQFSIKDLPVEAQISPLTSFEWLDFDRDGKLDLVGVGNDYGYEILGGRFDAGVGIAMKNNGIGNFNPVPVSESGFAVSGDSRDIVVWENQYDDRVLIVVSIQDHPFETFDLIK